MMFARWVLLVACSLCAVPGETVAHAQSSAITGRVFFAGDSGRAIADAEVALLPGLRVVRSDSLGRYRFVDVRPGVYTLRVRRVGFAAVTEDVALRAAQTAEVNVALPGGVQTLAEVMVSGSRVLYPVRLAEPYTRVARGRGKFFTRELIDSLQPWDMKTLLARLPAIRTNDEEIRVASCESHGTPGSPARLHVYFDGVRQTSYNGAWVRDAADVLRDIVLASVQLVEVHPSISTVPPEFSDDACAVILIWSR